MIEVQLNEPGLRTGWKIFASRFLSLATALIFAVLISVMSFLLCAIKNG